jgi:hypothetical protein
LKVVASVAHAGDLEHFQRDLGNFLVVEPRIFRHVPSA